MSSVKRRVSLFCWNIGINPHITSLAPEKVIPYLRSVDADILCLQEFIGDDLPSTIGKDTYVVLRKKKTNNHWNDNAILTKFPVVSWGELDVSSRGKQYEHVIWATLLIGKRRLRVYNCHLEITGVGPKDRIAQILRVYAHAQKAGVPCIICGDMNTTIPEAGLKRRIVQWVHKEPDDSIVIDGVTWPADERFLFTKTAESYGFTDITDAAVATWALPHTSIELFGLKLDYCFVKGVSARVTKYGPYHSDHKPLFIDCSF